MKKKSFFNGFNAKLALAVVALTGSLLTGCYKDEGLDIIDPDQSTTLPAATYTLVGTVVDANGELVSDATVAVSPNTSFKQNGASFTAAVAPGDVKITVTPKANAGYKGVVEKTVNVAPIKAGQSAVYTETIVLTKADEPVVEKVDAKYNVKVLAFASDDLNTPLATGYSVKLTNGKGETMSPASDGKYSDLAHGIYNVVVTPTDATKFEAYTTSLTLSQVKVNPDTENLDAEVYAVLMVKEAVQPEKEYKILTAYIDIEEDLTITKLALQKDGETIAESQSNYIIYLDQYIKGETHTYKLIVNYEDNGIAKVKTFAYGNGVSSLSVVLVANQGSVEVNDGKVEEDIEQDLDEDTELKVEEGTEIYIKIGDVETPYSGTFDVVRQTWEEYNPTTLRAFEGTPDGLIFKGKPLQITFKDNWGGELGALELQYWNDETGWKSDGTGSVKSVGNTSYVMNIEHFSKFKAEVTFESSILSAVPDTYTKVTTVTNGKNDEASAISVPFEFKVKNGSEISDVNAAIREAGFNNNNAVAYISNIINETLANNYGYVNSVYEYSQTKYIEIPAWSCLDSVTKTMPIEVIKFEFIIANKPIVINVTNWNGEYKISPEIVTFGHGHGHSHGHGQGNAGGGIIEAE